MCLTWIARQGVRHRCGHFALRASGSAAPTGSPGVAQDPNAAEPRATIPSLLVASSVRCAMHTSKRSWCAPRTLRHEHDSHTYHLLLAGTMIEALGRGPP